jgi:hypothetical protein
VDTIIEPLYRQLSQNLEINARRPTAKGYLEEAEILNRNRAADALKRLVARAL